jgi:hypothetical protein
MRKLLFSIKERDIYIQRTQMLQTLKRQEVEELETNTLTLKANVIELENSLVNLQEILAAKENDIVEVSSQLTASPYNSLSPFVGPAAAESSK